jgi:hypothetical protein
MRGKISFGGQSKRHASLDPFDQAGRNLNKFVVNLSGLEPRPCHRNGLCHMLLRMKFLYLPIYPPAPELAQ